MATTSTAAGGDPELLRRWSAPAPVARRLRSTRAPSRSPGTPRSPRRPRARTCRKISQRRDLRHRSSSGNRVFIAGTFTSIQNQRPGNTTSYTQRRPRLVQPDHRAGGRHLPSQLRRRRGRLRRGDARRHQAVRRRHVQHRQRCDRARARLGSTRPRVRRSTGFIADTDAPVHRGRGHQHHRLRRVAASPRSTAIRRGLARGRRTPPTGQVDARLRQQHHAAASVSTAPSGVQRAACSRTT